MSPLSPPRARSQLQVTGGALPSVQGQQTQHLPRETAELEISYLTLLFSDKRTERNRLSPP